MTRGSSLDANSARETLGQVPSPSAGMSSRGWHRLAEYGTCPARYAYKFLLRLEPIRLPEPLALGSLLHIGLMHHYLGRIGSPLARDPVDAMRTAPARVAYQFARAVPLFQAYRARYATEPIKILDVEREFRVTADGQLHTQRADLVVGIGVGREQKVAFFDHKCQSRIHDAALQEHATSGQFTGYEVIGRALEACGEFEHLYGISRWGGTYVNAIRTQPPIAASDSFRRLPLLVPPERVRRFPTVLREVNDMIDADARAAKSPWDYRQNPEACVGRWGACPYKPLCDNGQRAEAQFVKAADSASSVREGSGA